MSVGLQVIFSDKYVAKPMDDKKLKPSIFAAFPIEKFVRFGDSFILKDCGIVDVEVKA